jgi:hypothetical protein
MHSQPSNSSMAAISLARFQTTTQSVIPATSQDKRDTLANLVELPKCNITPSQYINCLSVEAHVNVQLSSISSLQVQQHLDDGF